LAFAKSVQAFEIELFVSDDVAGGAAAGFVSCAREALAPSNTTIAESAMVPESFMMASYGRLKLLRRRSLAICGGQFKGLVDLSVS
jgi:hypothetical protein